MLNKNFWNKTKDLLFSIFSSGGDRKEKKTKIKLSSFPLGQTVEVKLIASLDKIGISDPSGRMSLRFDQDDYQNKKIKGVVTGTKNVSGVDVVELDSVKIKNGIKTFRHYTIMLDEIENVKVLS